MVADEQFLGMGFSWFLADEGQNRRLRRNSLAVPLMKLVGLKTSKLLSIRGAAINIPDRWEVRIWSIYSGFQFERRAYDSSRTERSSCLCGHEKSEHCLRIAGNLLLSGIWLGFLLFNLNSSKNNSSNNNTYQH